MRKKAIISGVAGQDGSYLAEFLINKGYKVHGLIRRSSSIKTERIDHLISSKNFNKNFILHYSDITDYGNLHSLYNKIQPDEVYNLAAQSHVKVSFDLPIYTLNTDSLGTLNFLEIIKNTNVKKRAKFYQASSSEMYGSSFNKKTRMQDENTAFHPQSPYAVAKLYSYHITKVYRESYGIFACNGILFNHESPRRGETFVTKKIIKGLFNYLNTKKTLTLGNLYSLRDWGYAPEYVEGMWKIMKYKHPDDFVLATSKSYSVKDFINETLNFLKIKYKWVGKGVHEYCFDISNQKKIITISKKYFRPLEVDFLRGDFSKAKKLLNWQPKKNLRELVKTLLEEELTK